jgi:elongation factor G
MLEKLAECDEEFMDYYLSSDMSSSVSDDESVSVSVSEESVQAVVAAARRACLSRAAAPALCGAALRGKGVELLLNAVAALLPSPLDRPHVAAVDASSSSSSSSASPTLVSPSSQHLCCLAFKVVHDKDRGLLVFTRVYSGILRSKQVVRNSSRNLKERINQLLLVSASDYENISELSAGQVGCIVGLKETASGDTLVDERGPLHRCRRAGLDRPAAVFSVSVEPASAGQQGALDRALSALSLEDPSLRVLRDAESGQTVLAGVGELHLEIACNRSPSPSSYQHHIINIIITNHRHHHHITG